MPYFVVMPYGQNSPVPTTHEFMLQLFNAPTDPSMLAYGVYEPRLVVLSLLVAIFSSWMGLQITGRASSNPANRA
uniref:MHYT domain-containing protein n=1 Tax=Massilia timonae TaxID=47229 RepID=UPI00351D66F8